MSCKTVLALAFVALVAISAPAQSRSKIEVRISLGQTSQARAPFFVRLRPSTNVDVDNPVAWRGTAGGGRVETRTYVLSYPEFDLQPVQNMQVIWAYLMAHSDADTLRRFTQDPAWRPDPRKITFEFDQNQTRGFSLTVDQLLQCKTFWVPSLDVYISAGNTPLPFSGLQHQLAAYDGLRILEQTGKLPEATYKDFTDKWEDMGNPTYTNLAQEGPGHIVTLAWEAVPYKIGIDRSAGVWNDFKNEDQFSRRSWFEFGNLADGVGPYWKSQSLDSGLPIVTTTIERGPVRYAIEQFAYPLHGPPQQRGGDVKMVLMQRVRMTELSGKAHIVPVTIGHEYRLPADDSPGIAAEDRNGVLLLEDKAHRRVLCAIGANGAKVTWAGVQARNESSRALSTTVSVSLSASDTQEFFVMLPYPLANADERETLTHLNYDSARERTVDFWLSYLAKGAEFRVPDQAVNDLFRANLWHALMLPRRHDDGQVDLPYTNFGYNQVGTPWPINQAVYVDYMLYGLRGYNKIAADEIQAIFHNNQEFSGRISGIAHWLTYGPAMLYAVAQNYLLSNDKESFEKLLPETLRTLEWCIKQVGDASSTPGPTQGTVTGPLNDLTGTGYWAFNQAYLYAGIELMGKALERDGNPRAEECLKLARQYRAAIEHAFKVASVLSPLVQLRDHTWVPYVPSDIATPGRNFQQWYPSDVDTGATHLLRLKALPAEGELADSLLNDHEDNLFLHGWGMANEPVYNPQATAYLFRDDVRAVIRSFYSLMACGFSHSVYGPVEHRWRWPQYFGPPSTDGAWFELYRNMLVREADDQTLMLGQATPRAWLEDGKEISVQRAPTWFGKLSLEIQSHASSGTIEASFQLDRNQPGTTVVLRLRHPQERPLQQVTINGKAWLDFDVKKEWVRVPNVQAERYSVVAKY